MNKIFFAFRFSQKSLIPIYCIVLILIPCFVHPAFSMERSPIHKTIIQGPNVFKALVPSFRLRISHVIIERIGFSLEVVLQEHQPVEKLSARGSILTIPKNKNSGDRANNSTDYCTHKSSPIGCLLCSIKYANS